jgi:predicted MFS family arabinose efflux permease
MVWTLAIIALLALVMAFTTQSPGLMGFCLFVGFACGIVLAVRFIDRHVRASARAEHMTAGELEALRTTLRKRSDPRAQLPPPHAD